MFRCTFGNLNKLVVEAYGIEYFQLTSPSWMNGEFFDVSARVPKGATKEQFRLMLQNLLADRFKLEIHRETREAQVFKLVVAKGGPKFKEGTMKPAEENPPDAVAPAAPTFDKDGFAVRMTPAPKGRLEVGRSGKARFHGESETMQDLADRLADVLHTPVTDSTGLQGKYDYTLMFDLASAMGFERDADSDTAIPIESQLQIQLGLKLERKKGPVEFVVVDHMARVPTEN